MFIICDSNLNPTEHYCSQDTYFWPLKKICFSYYDCATDSTPDNDITNPCDGFASYESIPDKYSTDCTSYLQCYSNYYNFYDGEIEVPQVSRSICPMSGTAFKPGIGCVSDFKCANYQCATEGLFANPNVNDCSSYVKCKSYNSYSGGTASLLYSILKTCPTNTKYSPFLRKCDGFYNCDGVDHHNGIDPCTNFDWINPFVPNPYLNDCSSYLECQQVIDSNYNRMDVIVKKECPANTYFSPIIMKCYYNYDCSDSTCKKDPCINGVGKFVDYKSGFCEYFIECRDDSTSTDTYRPTYEKRYCPPGSLFKPEISDCDLDYVCPKFPVDYCYTPMSTTTSSTTSTADPD